MAIYGSARWADWRCSARENSPFRIALYGNSRFTEFLRREERFVSAIFEDRQGRLWLGTIDGLAQFRDGKVTMYSQRDAPSAAHHVARSVCA